MRYRYIEFAEPVGLEGRFNTFRLGLFYSKHLLPEETVYLLNLKEKIVFGTAKVERVEVGSLREMCDVYGHQNHTELANDEEGAADRLYATIIKLYGPHIALPNKKTSIIFMKRLE
jgi:hypothetical protein